MGCVRPGGPAHRWAIAAAVLVLAHTGWQAWQIAASPYPARYDYDEGVYAETAAAAAGGARLYQDVFCAQPPLLVAALARADRTLGASLAAARGTVALFSILWLASLFAIPAGAGRARAGALAAGALAGSPLFLVEAHTVQMEAPSEGLAAAAVALALAGARRDGILWWVAAGAAGGLAAMTKLTAAACAVPLVGAALLGPADGRTRRLAALAAGAVLAGAPFLAALSGREALSQVVVFHLSVARRMGAGPGAHLAAVRDFLAAGWPLAAAAALGMRRAAVRADALVRVSAMWLAAEGAVVMSLTPLWPHHLVVLLSPLALLAGVAADRLGRLLVAPSVGTAARPRATSPAAQRGAAALGAAAVLAYLAGGAAAAGGPGSSPDLRRAAAEVARVLPADAAVMTDDPMVPFLARRPVPPWLIDTSVARLRAGDLSLPVLSAALEDPRVGGVLLWRGTLEGEIPGVASAAAARFPVRVDLGRGRTLLVRRAGTTRPPGPIG